MGDGPEPSHGDAVPTTQPVAEEIPFARPITSSLDAATDWKVGSTGTEVGPTGTEVGPTAVGGRRADQLLLEGSTPGAALLDVVLLVVFVAMFDVLAGVVMGMVVGVGFGPNTPAPDPENPELMRTLLVPAIALRTAAAILIVTVILRYRWQRAGSVGIRLRGLTLDVPIGLGCALLLYGLVMATMSALWAVWPQLIDHQMEENTQRILAMVPNLHPLGLLVMATAIGLYEELLFRGFLMTRLRRATGSWTAAVGVSTVVFVALHAFDQVATALIAVTILSVTFSLVTIWRRSITAAIVAHTVWNLSQLLYLHYPHHGA